MQLGQHFGHLGNLRRIDLLTCRGGLLGRLLGHLDLLLHQGDGGLVRACRLADQFDTLISQHGLILVVVQIGEVIDRRLFVIFPVGLGEARDVDQRVVGGVAQDLVTVILAELGRGVGARLFH